MSSPPRDACPDATMRVILGSCVGGGPVERLARSLGAGGLEARVSALFDPHEWRTRMAGSAGDRLSARIGSLVAFPARLVKDALQSPASTVVPTTNPFFLPAVAIATRWLHGNPVVPLVYDLYPDAFEAVGAAARGGLLDKLATAMNRWWLRRADGVVFIGGGMAEHVRARYATPRMWAVIETGADVSEFEHAGGAAETELERWCAGKRIIGYVGNFGHVHDWETLAEAIPRVLAAHREVGVVVAASGVAVSRLKARWAALPGGAVRFESPLDDRAWARLLARTDISISTLREAAAKTAIPSKTFSAMAAGSAIVAVAPGSSDLARLVALHECGEVVAPGDVDGLVAAFARLLDAPGELDRRKVAAARAARDAYDMPKLAARWREFLVQARRAPEAPPRTDTVKRGIDLVLATGALVASAPLLLPAMTAVRVTLGSPVLFRQERPGLDGVPFEMIKLRTMRHLAPGEDASTSDAARLTPLGRFLRAASIDELPTLWNVVRGDMSLVGPRPLLMRYLPRYSPEQRRRHSVKPGITGWAQVNGRNAIGWEEKFALDVWYVDHRSLWLDLTILARTLGKVVRREGISHGREATMPEFMGKDGGGGKETP